MAATLHTLTAPAAHVVEVKHSRFLAQALPVDSADEAQAALVARSDPAATHNCWAWRFGDQYRSSDDGEPAGTAGRPILAAIDGQGCDQVLFAHLGDAHAALNATGASKSAESFDADGVHLRVRLPADRVDDLKTRLRDATRDRVRFAALG